MCVDVLEMPSQKSKQKKSKNIHRVRPQERLFQAYCRIFKEDAEHPISIQILEDMATSMSELLSSERDVICEIQKEK